MSPRVSIDMIATMHKGSEISESRFSWRRRTALLGAVLFALAAVSAPSEAARSSDLSPAERFATQAGNQAIATARAGGSEAQLRDRFRSLLRRYSNVSSVASFSLGRYADELPARRRAEYHRLVEDFTARLFATYAGSFAGHQVEVLRSNPEPPTISLSTAGSSFRTIAIRAR